MPASSEFEKALHNRGSYEEQLERLHARYEGTSRLYDLQQDGVPLASISCLADCDKTGGVLS